MFAMSMSTRHIIFFSFSYALAIVILILIRPCFSTFAEALFIYYMEIGTTCYEEASVLIVLSPGKYHTDDSYTSC